MAVVLKRSMCLKLKELTPSLGAAVQIRHQSGFPPVKTKSIDKTLELRSVETAGGGERPLVVIFGWMLARNRHLNKYGNLYLSKGFDVLSVQVQPQQVLWPVAAQHKITTLLKTLQDSSLSTRPIVIHGFSVGGYLYGEMLVKLQKECDRYKKISERIVGQVFDSPVDFEGVSCGFATVLVKNPVLRILLRKSIESYLKLMQNSVTKHYMISSTAFHDNHLLLPSLMLYSRTDPIGVAEKIEIVMEKWRSKQIPVMYKCWDNSPHVSHFHHHPDEYVESLLAFLDSIGFSTPERAEGEREKEIMQQQALQYRDEKKMRGSRD